jgi:hypothetical protein
MAKLVLKYTKAPEEFLTQEAVKIPIKLITKKTLSGLSSFDYREKSWNNFDLYSLCFAISRHGFGEWDAILKDEIVWVLHLKANDPKAGDDDLDDDDRPKKEKKTTGPAFSITDILIDKLCSANDGRVLKAPSAAHRYQLSYGRALGELLRKKATNFINLVFENSHHFTL